MHTVQYLPLTLVMHAYGAIPTICPSCNTPICPSCSLHRSPTPVCLAFVSCIQRADLTFVLCRRVFMRTVAPCQMPLLAIYAKGSSTVQLLTQAKDLLCAQVRVRACVRACVCVLCGGAEWSAISPKFQTFSGRVKKRFEHL